MNGDRVTKDHIRYQQVYRYGGDEIQPVPELTKEEAREALAAYKAKYGDKIREAVAKIKSRYPDSTPPEEDDVK